MIVQEKRSVVCHTGANTRRTFLVISSKEGEDIVTKGVNVSSVITRIHPTYWKKEKSAHLETGKTEITRAKQQIKTQLKQAKDMRQLMGRFMAQLLAHPRQPDRDSSSTKGRRDRGHDQETEEEDKKENMERDREGRMTLVTTI